MAGGCMLPSGPLKATDVNRPPSLELVLFGPVKLGRQLTVTVYAEDLFRRGPLAQHHVKAFSRFNGHSAEQSVIFELQDPASLISDGENGVLLTMTLEVVALVPSAAAPKHQKWGFRPPTDAKACSPKAKLATIAFGFRGEFNDVLFPAESVIHIPQSRFSKQLHLYVVVSDPDTHAIVYSSGAKGRPTLFSATAPQAARAPLVGGTGLGPGGPPADAAALVKDQITGMYEAFTQSTDEMGKQVPCLLVQLNQAGHAVAGWFARPVDSITNHAHLRLSIPSLPSALAGVEQGVLLGQFDGQFRIHWGETADTFVDPAVDELDTGYTGRLDVTGKEALTLVLRRNNAEATLYLRQHTPTPRLSNASIAELQVRATQAGLHRAIRETLRGQQVLPIPQAFWGLLIEDFTAEGKLGRLILKERGTSNRTEKRVACTEIDNYLRGLLGADRYRDAVVAHFTVLASAVTIEFDGIEHTTRQWLERIEADFVDGIAQEVLGTEGEVDNEHLGVVMDRAHQSFRDFGLVPHHLYEYEFAITSKGKGAKVSRFYVGAYAMELKIGRKVYNPKTERFEDDRRFASGEPPVETYYGVFGDAGIGLQLGYEPDSTEGNGMSASSTKPSGPPKKVSFRSVYKIEARSFVGASFYSISGNILSASASVPLSIPLPQTGKLGKWLGGPHALSASFGGASSAVVVVNVPVKKDQSVQLVGGTDSWFAAPKGKLKPTNPIGQPKPLKREASLTLFSLSGGAGFIAEHKNPLVAERTKDIVTPDERKADVRTEVYGYFRVNSASLEGRSLAALEEALAVNRALFVFGGGSVMAIGHASPEGPDNERLSELRAKSVIASLQTAFGDKLSLDGVDAFGRGSQLAEQEGMLKPPVPASQSAVYRKQYENEFKEYRFVLLEVNGVLLVRMRSPQEFT